MYVSVCSLINTPHSRKLICLKRPWARLLVTYTNLVSSASEAEFSSSTMPLVAAEFNFSSISKWNGKGDGNDTRHGLTVRHHPIRIDGDVRRRHGKEFQTHRCRRPLVRRNRRLLGTGGINQPPY